MENKKRNYIEIKWDDQKWIEFLKNKIDNESMNEKDLAYYNRILRVLGMNDLTDIENHPVNMIIEKIINSKFYEWFEYVKAPQIVAEWETFDIFNFPTTHVARRPSDSYFIQKHFDTKQSILLRPHTTIMWYHYLLKWWWIEKLSKDWDLKVLSWGKVYRVDEFDKTHHECFHQIDWLRICDKSKFEITQATLKEVLWNTIKAIFWENAIFRFNEDSFPYTLESLEVEVQYEWRWIEVLWAWVVHPDVLEKLGLDKNKYNGWAFWFWIERLAMALKWVPDIRIFWSSDKRITSQWWNFNKYKEVSVFPPVFKDISFVVEKTKFNRNYEEEKKSWKLELINEADSFEIAWCARDVSGWLIEEVKVIDIFEDDKKFWNEKKSVTIRITFRSLERTLTNDEINVLYFQIRNKLTNQLWFELR